jgi:single-strand DNA-binding protein
LRTRKWTDKDGVEKYTTEIYAEQMQLLGAREGGGGGGGGGDDQNYGEPEAARAEAPRRSAPPQRPPASAPAQKTAKKSSTGFDDMDDDIPF